MPIDTMTLTDADRDLIWHPFTQHTLWQDSTPLIIERADGVYLFDTEGKAYLDGVSSLWTNVHGHRHPAIDSAIKDQLEKVAHTTFLGLSHPPAIQLARRLLSLAPSGLQRVFYSDNGSTAVEVALKMSFQYHQQNGDPKRTRFATLADAYHGDTLGAVSVGAMDLFHRAYRPLLFEPVVLPAPTVSGGSEERAALKLAMELLERHADQLAAFIYEPLVQGAAGMKMHSPEFIRTLAEFARSKGILLIADEVAVGFGRTGTLFASEQVGVAPDLMCLAKGITAGYLPLAATLATNAIFSGFLDAPKAYRQFFHGHTYTANPLSCAAAIASLDTFTNEKTLENVKKLEFALIDKLAHINKYSFISNIRHKGVLIGIEIDSSQFSSDRLLGHEVSMAARPLGAIIRPLGDVLVINPPLSRSISEMLRLMDIVELALLEVVRR